MILVDTGPLIALFDPKDPQHEPSKAALEALNGPLFTSIPVLTEAFHLLQPASRGSCNLQDFVTRGGVTIMFFDRQGLARIFELMRKYADHPMDLADASLVYGAERLKTRRIFTIDRNDFLTYRLRLGRRYFGFELIP